MVANDPDNRFREFTTEAGIGENPVDVDIAYTISYHSPPISDGIIEASQYLFKISDMRPGDKAEVPFDFKGRVLFKKNNIDSIVESLSG